MTDHIGRAPTLKQALAALEDIAIYMLPVFTVSIDGKEEQVVPLENAQYLRERARQGLGLTPESQTQLMNEVKLSVETTPPEPEQEVRTTSAVTEPQGGEIASAVKKPTTPKFTKKRKGKK